MGQKSHQLRAGAHGEIDTVASPSLDALVAERQLTEAQHNIATLELKLENLGEKVGDLRTQGRWQFGLFGGDWGYL